MLVVTSDGVRMVAVGLDSFPEHSLRVSCNFHEGLFNLLVYTFLGFYVLYVSCSEKGYMFHNEYSGSFTQCMESTANMGICTASPTFPSQRLALTCCINSL